MSPLAGAISAALAVVAARPVPVPSADVQTSALPSLGPGEPGELSVTILETPTAGVPIELRLSGEVALSENRLGWASVVDPQAQQPRLRTRFVAPMREGSYRIDGVVRYLTCSEEGPCFPHAAAVSWTVVVEAPVEAEEL